jgi:AraC-like DNA-binding protein
MHFVQIGAAAHQTETLFRWMAAEPSSPYQSVWQITQSSAQPGEFRFIPDLSVHLVFDLSGLIDVEPFLIYTGMTYVDLDLPAGVELLGMQFAVWEALRLRQESVNESAIYDVTIDIDWAHLIYFSILDARNEDVEGEQLLEPLGDFRRWIDASLRKDFSTHFFQLMAQTETREALPYSERHERRLYRDLTGLSPTQFRRIVRFQNALQRIHAQGILNWDEYYDQAHFTREFKEFTGLTPAAFLNRYRR